MAFDAEHLTSLKYYFPLGSCKMFSAFELIFVLCFAFLWMMCSVLHTHMVLSHPWGIYSSRLMWILVWVKCSSHLCINAYCIINVCLKSWFLTAGEETGHFCVKTQNILVISLNELISNMSCWQDFSARAVLRSPNYFHSWLRAVLWRFKAFRSVMGLNGTP